LRRELSKINYHIHTDAIKQNLIPATLTKQQMGMVYANEADVCPYQGRLAATGAVAKVESNCDKPDDGTRIHRREQAAEVSNIAAS